MIGLRSLRSKWGPLGALLLVLFLFSRAFLSQDKEWMLMLQQQTTTVLSLKPASLPSEQIESNFSPQEIPSFDQLHCPQEYGNESRIEPKEFFVFHNGIIWCNVFKSASTSVLYMMGLLEGLSTRQLKAMSRQPLVSAMRKKYGRPTLAQLISASKKPNSRTFLVKRHPFKRLFSGYKNKILGAHKGSHHDKMSQKILAQYRSMNIYRDYKFRQTVPTFKEFVSYVLDNYEDKHDIDMHWAPVVDFCSVCKVNYTHVLDFDHLYEDMERMLSPPLKAKFAQLKLANVKLNVNKKSPVTEQYMKDNLRSLGPQLYQRLCQLYAKDFVVFGYQAPLDFEQLYN